MTQDQLYYVFPSSSTLSVIVWEIQYGIASDGFLNYNLEYLSPGCRLYEEHESFHLHHLVVNIQTIPSEPRRVYLYTQEVPLYMSST